MIGIMEKFYVVGTSYGVFGVPCGEDVLGSGALCGDRELRRAEGGVSPLLEASATAPAATKDSSHLLVVVDS